MPGSRCLGSVLFWISAVLRNAVFGNAVLGNTAMELNRIIVRQKRWGEVAVNKYRYLFLMTLPFVGIKHKIAIESN